MRTFSGIWIKMFLPNDELHDLYSLLIIIKMIKLRIMRWARNIKPMGEKRITYTLLVGKPEGTRPQGGPIFRRVNNIKVDVLEREFGGVNRICPAQDRYRWRAVLNAIMKLRLP
jgi:hypothetical protein